MRKAVWLLVMALGCTVFGCNEKQNQPAAPAGAKEQQGAGPQAGSDRELALKFLGGIQAGDKKLMYDAAHLTTAMVDESREKLIHAGQHKLDDQERKELENVLRISGEIDFFSGKIRKLFPRTSTFRITGTKAQDAGAEAKVFLHTVQVSYPAKEDAFIDKTGRPMKEMTLPLQQVTRVIKGRSVNEFSFDSKVFERIGMKDFDVVSYY